MTHCINATPRNDPSREALVVLNAASTSLKFGAYAIGTAIDDDATLPLLCRGHVDSMHGDPHFVAKDVAGKPLASHDWGEGHAIDHKATLQFLIDWLATGLVGTRVAAAGPRVVHGGTRFAGPVRLDAVTLDYLDSMSAVASPTSTSVANCRPSRPRARRVVIAHLGGGASPQEVKNCSVCGSEQTIRARRLNLIWTAVGGDVRCLSRPSGGLGMSPFRTESSFRDFDTPSPGPASTGAPRPTVDLSEERVPRHWWSRTRRVKASDSARKRDSNAGDAH